VLATTDYCDLADTPSRNSPVGQSLMRRILDESPAMTFEQARELANQQLSKAAGRKNYIACPA